MNACAFNSSPMKSVLKAPCVTVVPEMFRIWGAMEKSGWFTTDSLRIEETHAIVHTYHVERGSEIVEESRIFEVEVS